MKNSILASIIEKLQAGGQHLIARKILFFILLFSSFVTVLVTGFQLYSYYQEQAAVVDHRITQIELSYRDSLANAIWFFAAKQIDSILTGIMKFEDVHYAEVKIETGGKFYRGERRQGENLRVFDTDVLHEMKSRSVLVGRLLIESNLEGVIQRVGGQFWQILMSQAFKTFFVSLFILFIIHYIITRHLSAISSFASSLDIGQKNKFLSLNRAKTARTDELDQIVYAMNKMKGELIADAAEREQAENRLKKFSQAVEQNSAAMLILDSERCIEYVNPKFESSTGYSSSEVLGKVADIFIFGDKAADACQEIWALLLSNNKWRGEVHSHQRDGSQLWETVSISLIVGPKHETTHFLVLKDDISDLRQAEEKIRHAQKMEAVGELTGGIAHDFNNILGIVQGNLEILNDLLKNDEKAQSRIQSALKGTTRGADLTRKLLNFSRKEMEGTKRISISSHIHDMEDFLIKSLTVLVDVNFRLDREVWLVDLDPGDLQDTIVNLTLNARDAMPEGGTLTIETGNKVLDEEYLQRNPLGKTGDFVMLSVSDTGHGMNSETKDRVTEPFFTTKELGKGTGLGLSMVYGFVQRSGGHLKIYSEEGIGTTFRLYFPRAKDTSEQKVGAKEEFEILPSGTEKILIVDDENDLCEIAAFYLEDLGYRTVKANDGQQALDILSNGHDIDVLFSDVVMPGGLDGYQLASTLHDQFPDLKILLASGYTKKKTEINGGDNKYMINLVERLLRKPYNQAELSVAIRDTIDRKL